MRVAITPLGLLILATSTLIALSAPPPAGGTFPGGSAGPLTAQMLTTAYTRLYVFGDSYSDFGAGYVDCDGPTAVAYLGWNMGLSVAHAKAANATDKSLIYAVSGARTGEGEGHKTKDALLSYGMLNQVRDFAARVKTGEIKFDPQTTLFFFAGGLNDRGLPLETTVANLKREITIIHELGGKHFTIALLPVKIRQFTSAGTRLNPALPGLIDDVKKNLLGVDIWLNHWGAYFDEVMEHPVNYGIVNTSSQCAGRAIFDQDATPVADPATYFFYHEGHPSTAVHRVVGRKLFEELAALPTSTPAQSPARGSNQ